MKSLGARPVDYETDAIMNDVQTADRMVAGTLVKFVERLH
jgi:hypothetical protein